MTKVLVIVGATASGKSDLAIALAKKFNGEIISGDSIQVYKGLDIGSAKTTNQQGIKHHLIDILDAKQNYSVYDFQKNARAKIQEISDINKLPIIVGGTGLYIKACLNDYEFITQPSTSHLFEDIDNQTLYQKLLTLDIESAKKIHPNNRQRIVRALNICLNNDLSKSALEKLQKHQRIYDVLMIGIKKPRAVLYQDIELRVKKMFEKGLLQEVETLLNQGLSFENQALKAIGYKEFKDYFKDLLSLEEVSKLIIRNTKRYAKRQETWFNNQEDVLWFETIDDSIFDKVGDFLNE